MDMDRLSRTLKLELDEGRAMSLADAERITSGYVLQVAVGPEIAASTTMQAMMLTVVNAAARAFPGGVRVRHAADPVLDTPWACGETLTQAVVRFGGSPVAGLSPDHPTLVIGTVAVPVGRPVLQLTWNGWIGAAVVDPDQRLAEQCDFPPAGVLAAALGVSEMFQHVRGSTRTGHRDVGLSLWNPGANWQNAEARGPRCRYLPQRLAVVGLGHVGQAVCWTLGLLAYPDRSLVEFTLQDFDKVIDANVSTGLLTRKTDLGRRKTRVVAERMEKLGFGTTLVESRVDEHTRRTVDEPTWAIGGFDKVEPRRHLVSTAGYTKIVDIGLGATARDYLDILIHVFPGGLTANQAWPKDIPRTHNGDLPAAYQQEIKQRLRDGSGEAEARCGVVQIADRSVAATFVGLVAACLTVAELVRALHGGPGDGVPAHEIIAADLANPSRIDAVPNRETGAPSNPGWVAT